MKRILFFALLAAALVGCTTPDRRPLVVGLADICETNRLAGVRPSYCEAVYKSGGVPFILPATSNRAEIARALDHVDAVILCGGEDVAPARYRAAPSPHLGKVNELRDDWEWRLLDAAVARRLPVVGICRGEQFINVYFGGTLWQDLPSEYAGAIRHRGTRHEATFAADSRVARLIGRTQARVNSSHHQAVKDVAPGFRVVGRAPDGVVEAIESETLPVAAVQFHPEALYVGGDETFAPLFRELLAWAGAARASSTGASTATGEKSP